MRRLWSLLLAVALILCLLPAAWGAELRVEDMTTEEKICQMLLPAFRLWAGGNLTAMNDDLAALLTRYGFAGVILFAENTEKTADTVRLVDGMQQATARGNHPQLLMAIDQEGGTVTRLGQGTAFPGNMALGAVGDLSATTAAARTIGEELRALGIQLDLAPVADVNSNPANPIIGTRAFSDDPETVAEQTVAFMEGLAETGTIATLKHFPGHGDTATDSHTGLPRIGKTYEELAACELVPFRAGVDAGAEVIMTAHIQFPAIETETYISRYTGGRIALPATLSKTFLTDILRGELGYQGVIVTDALDMDAISRHFSPLDAARLAICAGADILLMPVDPAYLTTPTGLRRLERLIADLTALVDSGTIPEALVDAAVGRILALKARHGLLSPYDGTRLEERVAEALATVGSRAHHAVEWSIAKRAVTLVKNQNNLLPLREKNQNVLVLTAYENERRAMAYAVNRLRDEQKLAEGTSVTIASLQGKSLSQCLRLAEGMDHVIAVSEVGSLAGIQGNRAYLLEELMAGVHRRGGTFTVVSGGLPYDAARFPQAEAVVIAWNARGMSQDPRVTPPPVAQYGASLPAALYMLLSTADSPSGTLPVNLPALRWGGFAQELLYPRGRGMIYDTWDKYPDLDAGAWYAPGVAYALSHRLMQGTGYGFRPESLVTRAQAVVTLWRLAGEPRALGTEKPYTDLPPDHWAGPALTWAAEQGLTQGMGDGTFRPEAPLTREQFALLLHRFAAPRTETSPQVLTAYLDGGTVSPWAKEALAWAVRTGLVQGVGEGQLRPQETLTRAQLATLLMRADG